MDEQIRARIRQDIGGDEQRIHQVDTRYADVRFKHLLLPVWVSAYRYRERAYRFLVNARTGEVQGERPWSWVKIALAVLVALLVALLVAVLAGGGESVGWAPGEPALAARLAGMAGACRLCAG